MKTKETAPRVECRGGEEFRQLIATGTTWLEKSAADIDAINVFPVPDGDTGTNMLLTMRSAMEEAYRNTDPKASSVAAAVAYGALMGARGNSGVILSQVFRGFARALEYKDSFCAGDLAAAMENAAADAYKGLAKPVEGTMLTVMRDAAAAARTAAAAPGATVADVMAAATRAARESVARTPMLLPVLREAGVVDAGGQGLFVIFEGATHYLKGEREALERQKPEVVPAAIPLALRVGKLSAEREEPYGYCTEFIVQGEQLDPDRVRSRLASKGVSLVVVGDGQAVRVHIHTMDPGNILCFGLSLGTLHQIKVENMDDQNREFLRAQRARPVTEGAVAVVAVSAGEGFAEVFRSLGVAAIVQGGQTMNPSVREILKAVEDLAAARVIVLANNKNIVHAANQVPALSSKQVAVVPSQTLPQGIAALLAFNPENDLEMNAKAMAQALKAVRTVEVTRAVRSTKINGLKVMKGQAIGIVDGRLVVAGDDVQKVLSDSLARGGAASAELVTLYYGADTTAEAAGAAARALGAVYPELEVQVVNGGQPHYFYVVSVE